MENKEQRAQSLLSSAENVNRALKGIVDTVHQNAAKEKQKVSTTFSNLIRDLKQQEAALLLEIEKKEQDCLAKLESNKQEAEAAVALGTSLVTQFRTAKGKENDPKQRDPSKQTDLDQSLSKLAQAVQKNQEETKRAESVPRQLSELSLKIEAIKNGLRKAGFTVANDESDATVVNSGGDAKAEQNIVQEQPFLLVGQKGDRQAQFNYPWGVSFDAKKERIYVSEHGNHRLQCIDRQGKFVWMTGSEGAKQGQLSCPRGVCVQPATQTILVADTYNRRISLFSNDGKFVGVWPEGPAANANADSSTLKNPCGMACDRAGRVLVADVQPAHKVCVLDDKGHFLRAFGSEGSNLAQFQAPHAVCVDQQGRVLVADNWNKRIVVWSSDYSQPIKEIAMSSDPSSICIDASGNIIVGCTADHCICVIDSATDKLRQTIGSKGSLPGQFKGPNGVCIDDNNVLVVSDSNNHRLQIFK